MRNSLKAKLAVLREEIRRKTEGGKIRRKTEISLKFN